MRDSAQKDRQVNQEQLSSSSVVGLLQAFSINNDMVSALQSLCRNEPVRAFPCIDRPLSTRKIVACPASPVCFRVIGVAYREEGDAISDIVCTVGVEISR